MEWAVRKVRPHIHVGHPHRPIFSISRNHAPATPVEDDSVVDPQEAREGLGHFREVVLRDIMAGWLALGKCYRRGGDDSGGEANHNLTLSSPRTWAIPRPPLALIKCTCIGFSG